MSHPSELRDCRVLIADDDPLLREVYSEVLRRHGCTVATASDGEECVRMALDGTFDLLLVDMRMPRLDGPGTVRALRADTRTAQLIVVAISGQGRVREDALADGFDAFVEKSSTPAGLVKSVESALRVAVERRRAGAEGGHVPPAALLASVLSALLSGWL